MTRILFLTTTCILPFMSLPAMADCSPDSVGAGESVVCTGSDIDGFEDGSDLIDITVESGAEITTGGKGIDADGDEVTVIVDGVIASGDEGVNGGGDDMAVVVGITGSIHGDVRGIDARDGDRLTVINDGTITAGEKAIRNDDSEGAYIYNSLTGVIAGGTEGIEGGDAAVIINEGVVTGVDDAVQVEDFALIENFGRIENVGTDPSDPQDAIDIDSGTVINHAGGVIRSTLDAAIDFDAEAQDVGIIENHGVISGTIGVLTDPANTFAQLVYNEAGGVIEGTSGAALDLGQGEDFLSLVAGSELRGAALMGDGDDKVVFGSGFFSDPGSLLSDGALFDGGEGYDLVGLTGVGLDDILGARLAGGDLTLRLAAHLGTGTLLFRNWEGVELAEATWAVADLAANFAAPVPLPGGLVLLGGGLAGFGLIRRRARA